MLRLQGHEAAEAEARQRELSLAHESKELRAALAAAQHRERQQGRLLADITTLAANAEGPAEGR